MQENKLKIFLIKEIPNVVWIPVLDFVFGQRKTNDLFQNIDFNLYADAFDIVKNPEEADFFLVPHVYSRIKDKRDYINDFVSLSEKYQKSAIIFAYQDSSEKIDIPRTIIFRPSQYRSSLAENEVIMPAFVENMAGLGGVFLKDKKGKPSVGFVGKAGFENFFHFIKFFIKNTFLLKDPFKSGIYYRKRAMSFLSKSKDVVSNFIVRSSYSGNLKSIPLDPSVARKEYLGNIISNDFTLCLKGDGNYSLRFYETLALGRIPLFIDTDCVLPMEDIIKYDDIIIRVDYKNIASVASLTEKIYQGWSQEEYVSKQRKAREVFEKYLYMPVFIKNTFNKKFLSKYEPEI